jgi:hypothetical protein
MLPEDSSTVGDNALAGLAPERPERRSESGDAIASADRELSRNREKGRGGLGERGLVSPDLSFDPAILDRDGEPSNSPSQITITGSEDWLTVNFHVNHSRFDDLSKSLDAAQRAAGLGSQRDDEIQVGDFRFIVADRGARQGRGEKFIFMRWRLTSENGLVLLLMNKADAHKLMPNITARATSLLLMRFGFDRVWGMMQYCIEQLGGEIVANKLSRVDPCVDLPGVPVSDFVDPFTKNWIVSRSRLRSNYAVGTFVNEYLQGKRHTGFTIGKSPCLCRIYDKLVESQFDLQKRAILEATRWGGIPECASRVEFQLERQKLKHFGIDSVDDWIGKRAEVIDELTTNWLRLTDGPVDRKHADRTALHPVWIKARDAFFVWCGASEGQELIPLAKLDIRPSRQVNLAIGILKGMFARVGKDIQDNEQFFREVDFAIRDAVHERGLDMAWEVQRKSKELGNG